MQTPQKVFSIQSHVAEGYAGNKAAVFPMQRLGIDVTPIHTVQFSNHTGHQHFSGDAFSAEHIQKVFSGLAQNAFLGTYDALLTGYMGSIEIAECVLESLMYLKQHNAELTFCCDPVFGDTHCGTYTQQDLPTFFKEKLIPHATIIKPNQYELSQLTNIDIVDTQSALVASGIIHELGPKIVLLTSYSNPLDENSIGMLLSTPQSSYLIQSPKHPIRKTISGTGDITAALFLTHYLQNQSLEKALSSTFNSVYGMIKITTDLDKDDLALIESQNELVQPSFHFKVQPLTTI